jgi:ATP-dependent DNA helicase RecQ
MDFAATTSLSKWSQMAKPQRDEFVAGFLDSPATRPAIVYAPSRKAADYLALRLQSQFPAGAYHAGLEAATRERVQRQFQASALEVVVATIAFGMGIDKPNVRTIIHTALPGSVEAYYQEIGRAGRDGLPSRAILLHSFADRRIHDSFFERDYPPVEDLDKVARALTGEFQDPDALSAKLNLDPDSVVRALEKLAAHGAAQFDINGGVRAASAPGWRAAYKAQLEHRRAQLEHMVHFAETPQCRMSALVRHFGDRAGASRPCGHCDFCAPHAAVAQQYRGPTWDEEHGLRNILQMLRATPSTSAGRLFEASKVGDRNSFERLLDGLARAGLVSLTSENWVNPLGRAVTYRRVTVTDEGRRIGPSDPHGVLLPEDADAPAPRQQAHPKEGDRNAHNNKTAAPAFTGSQAELEARLREWRKAEAA